MHRAPKRLSRVSATIALAFALSAAPASAAGYLKLGDAKGESTDKRHGGQIEIESWSWGATRRAGAVTEFNTLKTSSVNPPAGQHGEWIADVERPADKNSGGGTGTIDSNEKITIHGGRTKSKLPGKRTPPTVTLKRGTSSSAAPHGRGLDIATVDGEIVSPGRAAGAAPMQYNPKEYTISKSNDWVDKAAPASRGTGRLTALVPAGMCRAGARYPTAELGTGDRVYRLENVTVSGCAPASSGGDRPMESISLNYTKVSW